MVKTDLNPAAGVMPKVTRWGAFMGGNEACRGVCHTTLAEKVANRGGVRTPEPSGRGESGDRECFHDRGGGKRVSLSRLNSEVEKKKELMMDTIERRH